jgi:hypothetical protein
MTAFAQPEFGRIETSWVPQEVEDTLRTSEPASETVDSITLEVKTPAVDAFPARCSAAAPRESEICSSASEHEL